MLQDNGLLERALLAKTYKAEVEDIKHNAY